MIIQNSTLGFSASSSISFRGEKNSHISLLKNPGLSPAISRSMSCIRIPDMLSASFFIPVYIRLYLYIHNRVPAVRTAPDTGLHVISACSLRLQVPDHFPCVYRVVHLFITYNPPLPEPDNAPCMPCYVRIMRY